MPEKKIPQRLCVGCGEMKPKRELIRVVKNKECAVLLDATGKAHGRGAYICNSAECLEKARKNRRLEKSFEMKIPDEVYEEMKKRLEE